MVVSDSIKNADAFLSESLELVAALSEMRNALVPFSSLKQRVRIAQFITETSKKLKSCAVHNFAAEYPTITNVFESGSIPDSCMHRFNDAMYSLSAAMKQIADASYIIKLDADRMELQGQLSTAIGGFISTLYNVFRLGELPDTVTLAVSQHCEVSNITPDVFKGSLLKMFEDAGAEWYIFEPQNPMYQAVYAFDPGFLGQMEEEGFTITQEQAEDLVTGNLSIAELGNQLSKHIKNREDVDVNPTGIIKSMNLGI